VIASLSGAAFAAGFGHLPEAASTTAKYVDGPFWFIYALCAITFVGIVVAMGWLVAAYKQRGPDDRTSPMAGSHLIELVWSVLPTIGLFAMFWFGFKGFIALNVVPPDAMEIRATGQKWYWTFDYPDDGITVSAAPELAKMAAEKGETVGLVVPINQPVKLIGSSVDVLHSMSIPAFRVKKDVMPNRYTVLWFEATKEGVYDFFCTEYCGTDHSRMVTKVIVKSQADYAEWVASQANKAPATGPEVFAKYGCTACHSVDGAAGVGPTMKGLAAKGTEQTTKGPVTVDDNYLRKSIVDPMADVVQGFAPAMPTFAGRISDQELDAVIDYIKTLK